MFTRYEIYYTILFVVGSIFAANCPNNETCKCTSNELVEINCKINNSSIKIQIKPGQFMKVYCSNFKWSDLHTYNFTKYETNWVYFFTCNLPKNNSLKTITDMLGTTDVEYLHFHSKKSLSFKKLHLKGFENLYLLDLSYNYIVMMDKYLLEDLTNLKTLIMRDSNLQTTFPFYYPPQLREIDLGENKLISITPGSFDKCRNLTFLSLEKNNLTELESGIFDKLINLESLYLTSNNLVSLPEDIFAKLKNLETLSLTKNSFTFLPRYLLQNNTNLQIFDLSFNEKKLIDLPNKYFQTLTKLKILNLEKNGFTRLPEDLLWGCFSLTTLSLSGNDLGFLPKLIFRDLKRLRKLKLDSNALEELHNYIFSDLRKLRKLDLSKNRLRSINNQLFQNLIKLEKLNMADNSLSVISDKSFNFLSRLRIANFSNNSLTLHPTTSIHIDEQGIRSPFTYCHLLRILILSHNNISEIFDDWILNPFLQILDLKNNYISNLSTHDLQFASKSIDVDLTYNKIRYINLKNVEDFVNNNWLYGRIVIWIEHNPLHCDCGLYDFLRYIENKMLPNVTRNINIYSENLICSTPFQLKDVRVINLQSESCVANNTDIMMCPDKCNCFVKQEEKTFMIDCFRKNLTFVPSFMIKPPDSWQVELNLSNNHITQMPNLTNLSYRIVSKLVLSHNNISEISLDGLSKTLKALEIHNNNITRISSDVLNFLRNATNLTLLTLGGNPLICDCNITDFLDFIITKSKIIADLHNVTCYGKNKLVSNMMKMKSTDFCPIVHCVKNNEEQSYTEYIYSFISTFKRFIADMFYYMY
ncbi:protein toll isoform X1 [Linepithema humile]|uniref:protein toll isoform X1 n=1 Tax=Linepithema humile TaxID=83485 RepID=UPI00351EED2D